MSAAIGSPFERCATLQPAAAQHLGQRVAARRMPRRQDQRQHRQRPPGPGMGGERDLLLARMGRGREPDRPPGERPRDPHPLGLVVGQGRRALLQRALDRQPAGIGAEQPSAARRPGRPGRGCGRSARAAPAPCRRAAASAGSCGAEMRALISSIGMPRRVGLAEHRRPELALGPDREVGPPVVEEPLAPRAPRPSAHTGGCRSPAAGRRGTAPR